MFALQQLEDRLIKLELFPEIEPYRTGTLKVSAKHTVFFEEAGNPNGKPALFLHGGPGVGIHPDYRRFFDPEFYRVILLDQRGAGRSTPHAALEENTTWDIVEDLEKLRNHLKLDAWVVMGGSWGSTLGLCYAITYPKSVRGLIIRGIFLARPFEHDWLFRANGGASRIFPDEWERYVAAIPEDKRDDPMPAYYKILTGNDHNARKAAAEAWTRWEAYSMNLVPNEEAIRNMLSEKSAMSIARTECHFAYNKFFLRSDNETLDNADKIAHIPWRIVQGRHDIICPPQSAWDLHKALPKSDLRMVPDGAHSPTDPGMIHELITASQDFKSLY